MLEKLKAAIEWLGHYAKAIVAVASPFVIDAIIELGPTMAASTDRVVSIVGTAIVVWLIPNLPKRTAAIEAELA